jgi:hypothetical protein
MEFTPASWEQIVSERRSARQKEYDSYAADLRAKLTSTDPEIAKKRKVANDKIVKLSVSPGEVHVNRSLTNMSLKYANDDYIGEELMPELKVSKKSDVYFVYDKRDRLGFPDDKIGERGRANEITQSRTTDSYICEGRGLEGFVSEETIQNQDEVLNELVDMTESVNEGLLLNREVRIAGIVNNTANYAGNTAAVTSWANGAGNPVRDIKNAHKSLWTGMGPGMLVGATSYDVFLELCQHPALIDLFKASPRVTDSGLITADMMARTFGLDRILVGRARQDTANEGQTAAYSRIWADSFAILRVARRATKQNASFGYTIRHIRPETVTWFDRREGVRGGWYTKTSTSETHKVVAGDTSYLLTGVLA